MKQIEIDTITKIVNELKDALGWTNLACLGSSLTKSGINYKSLGYLRLKELFQDPEMESYFELKTDDTHDIPVCYVKSKKSHSKIIKKSILSKCIDTETSIVQWASIPFREVISKLEEMALPERWYFGKQDPTNPYPILGSYIRWTFYRLVKEKKVAYSNNGEYAAFNTGLVNKLYEPIFALFKKNINVGRQPWYFYSFCIAGAELAGKTLSSFFNPLPEKARYFKSYEDFFYDSSKNYQIDWDHIILENIARLPIDFLERNRPSEFLIQDTSKMTEEAKKEYFTNFATAIKNDYQCNRAIKMRMKDALEIAIKKVDWNYKTAIPIYYPTRDVTSLLLPLSLVKEENVDVALVMEKTQAGNYIGQTILTMDMAYQNARLITRPDSDWLIPSNVDEIVDEEI